jgi:hypothetical protein
LQAIEINQNRQTNRWKCLEGEALNLEMLGGDLENRGAAETSILARFTFRHPT